MTEFKRGDTVTFNAYEGESITARVVEVVNESPARYRLEGLSKRLITITTGICIRESNLFVEPGELTL